MTAADRLLQLAGATGTAAALLLSIGAGATAGAALVAYSGVPSATSAVHLLTDHQAVNPPSSGGWVHTQKRRKTENDEAFLIAVLL